MSDRPKDEAAGVEPRLHFEDEAGAGTGRRDLAGLAIAAGLFVLAAVVYNDATGYVIRRSYARFGPDIAPYLVATGVAVMGVLTVVMAWRGRFEARERLNVGGVLWVVAGLAAQIGLIYGGAGFILASTVLFACAARAFGQTTVLLNVVIGATLVTSLYLLFRYGLGLALPGGPIERTLALILR
jgi:putative tricarboxylic transport membrane protein